MSLLKTTIGLEIHVQLNTKSKMFCRCDNDALGKIPNTIVCPVCLGLPGALPVANKEAIRSTIKTGLILNCKISKIAKFDRKHYFYPDLPKGYQISQYDEPFCVGGFLEIEGQKIRLNRIHLEEDAGKLIHSGGNSLVDLNRAGTPLMEIVTEPDITSVSLAGNFLRKLQKIVRDVAAVSEASMEKGHLRCDANISISDEKGRMSEIVELKNINSFRFVEKALTIEEARLKEEYPDWSEKKRKVTRGYDSKKISTYPQRVKEEASDYRYFPEPDLPPIDTSIFDLEALRLELNESENSIIKNLVSQGVLESDAKFLANSKNNQKYFNEIGKYFKNYGLIAKVLVHNYFGFAIIQSDFDRVEEYAKLFKAFDDKNISKTMLTSLAGLIHDENLKYDEAIEKIGGVQLKGEDELKKMINEILSKNSAEVDRYKSGERRLLGFFMGQIMHETKGKANPEVVNKILLELLK